MRGKTFMFVFALPFPSIGMWMGFSMFGHACDAWQMRSWAPTSKHAPATMPIPARPSHDSRKERDTVAGYNVLTAD